MPNHVTNVIALNGDRKQIRELLEQIQNDELGLGTMDFNKIIPMPNEKSGFIASKTQNVVCYRNNKCDWAVANWGTKWNAYGYDETVDYARNDSLRFLTAWSAPHPIMQRLSEMFPEIEMILYNKT